MQVDTKLVRELAALLDSTHLSEIEVQDGERRIRVARQMTGAVAAAPVAYAAPAAPAAAAPAEAAVDDIRKHPGLVKSPIVGTAYLTPEPGAAPFVSVGASVKAGDTLLIIEAMKVMNTITAPKGGKVTQILVGNEAPVEYDQPLVVIE
ncbi:MAG TPA: acetyl-CoA carboxylase biotin carboxyl carrier protein [Polymorphobacter sp.]|nr:acetyl-CoA carboxylase biotin carboxyl carrier protein [Polymorphobacter sp.]